MARFPFVKGRKKSPPPLVLTEHMSKAHKILGSTPINIDSPKPWDDAFSAFSGGTGNSTASSYASSDNDDSDHHVAIASSEGDEWIHDSGIRPAVPESSGFDNANGHGMRDTAHSLRKTQSSSTIRSSYDRSKQLLSVSQQTSSPSMIQGVPSKVHKMLDLESNLATKSKRKPPMLDFSNLRAVSRLSRKASHAPLRTDGTVSTAFESTATLSPTPLAPPTSKPRKIQKRITKGSLASPALERHVPRIAGDRPPGSPMKEAPSLYDHYEQMTLRQLMQEAESLEGEQQAMGLNMEDDEEVDTENDEEPWTAYDSPWLQDILPPTPQTAFMTGLKPAASHHRTTSTTSKMTSSTKRSKTLDRSDLQETSMLMLSDSEEDEEPTLPRSQTTTPSHYSPAATVSRAQSSRASSQASNYKPMRNSKKTSFAPVDTYITLPQSSRLSTDTATPPKVDSRSSTPCTGTASRRTSLTSEVSSASALPPGSNYIQEARAVTMLAGRRPSRVDNGEENSPDGVSFMTSLSPAARRALNLAQTPPEELTPPLSPTSVDFFIRSARSSIDGSGSQNRYMAFTLEEQILFSSLRNKKQYGKEQSAEIAQGSKRNTFAKESIEEENEEDDELFSGMGTIAGEAMLHFGFPVPPSARRRSCFEDALDTSASMSSRASTATSDKLSQSSMGETEDTHRRHQSSLRPSITRVPSRGILKAPGFQRQEPERQETMMDLDEAESTLDISDLAEFGYLAMPSLQTENFESSAKLGSSGGDTMLTQSLLSLDSDAKGMDRAHRLPGAMAPVPEDSELEYEGKDIPRPDSPISPDAFPAVPQIRTTLSSMARLSAVGSTSMMTQPGWWGDDD
ncbi:hypothetical protein ISF_04191 [Cordyceps fumosorosea ARSEF 2679]|uniref:Uncharacterized protein n=1 Tax=Cordyceps fumosorosea (strain ARSEF 2679) TaxID=1081104 RepID=A0A167XBW5_CORFA|nr:hypothetical protein ISF_04191 [Cordyceps fumosorosea ARSEF 2679]OAA64781.1 hypothetical protein ISF_04191 [Cordyceps fumosorosea ARSEF 2679]